MSNSISYPHPVEAKINPISATPIDLGYLVTQAHDPKAGAVVMFSGEARNHNKGASVTGLEYEAYEPMAAKMIDEIVQEAITKFSLHKAFCVHRVGLVGISESAVVVVTASSHRGEAYEANRYIIDRVKHEAPIWKMEVFADGSKQFSHNCSCHNH